MTTLGALASGLLFGAGLAISGMVDPAVVLGFLDFGGIADGSWNPALAGVMGGAIPVTFMLYKLAGDSVPAPSRKIDPGLILGSAVFGVGWGMAGLCPGPALEGWVVSPRALLFVVPMLAGFAVTARLARRAEASRSSGREAKKTSGLA
jgi:uncharacterized membrane protein YedE/YeeE